MIVTGPRGSGKTIGPLAHFASYTGRGYGESWKGGFFRRTFPELRDAIAKSLELFPRLGVRPVYNKSQSYWEWPTGEILYFLHMRTPMDYWKYHGWSLPWIDMDELTTWPTSECWDLVSSINRGTSEDGKPMPIVKIGVTNPHGAGHNWVKKRAVDPGPPGTIVRTEDTVYLPDEEGEYHERKISTELVRIEAPFAGSYLEKHDPNYMARLLVGKAKHIKEAWGRGGWDITSGGMFDDLWSRGIHALPAFDIPLSWKIIRAYDHGQSHPFSFGLWAIADDTNVTMPDGTVRSFTNGTLIRIREFYGTTGKDNEGLRWTSNAIGEKIRQKEDAWGLHARVGKGPADGIWVNGDDGTAISDTFADWGIRFKKPRKEPGSRVAGWEQIRSRLESALKYPPEGPALYVFERECPHFLRLMPLMQRDDKNLDDIDTDSEDHIADEMRYVALERKPAKKKTGPAPFIRKSRS